MGRRQYIAKPNWKWLLTAPTGFVTLYNVYRAEINPDAPILLDVIHQWPWWIWALITLLTVAIIIIEALWRYNRNNPNWPAPPVNVAAKSENQSGGQNFAQNAETIHNIFPVPGGPQRSATSVPSISTMVEEINNARLLLAEKVTIKRSPNELNKQGHEEEFSFIVNNDSGIGLDKCKVFLEEIAYRKSELSKGDWKIVDGLPSSMPFEWNEDGFLLCELGLEIDNGAKGLFTVLDQYPLPHYNGKTYYTYEPKFTFCDERISADLKESFDYRVRVKLASRGAESLHHYIYLRAHKSGYWEFERLERIS